jgi:hypothetical protein
MTAPAESQALVLDRGADTAVQKLQGRVAIILEVMARVLKDKQDYGKIPGTSKPTLFKPGAEKLLLTFNMAAAQPSIEDLSDSDAIRYRVGVPIEGPDGRVLAVGVGEASSNEEKYRWRKPVCDQEFEETAEHLRREKWFAGQNGPWKGKQIRTSPADLANTILKMAHKRAFIGGTLLATGASSVFNQDLEDFAKELRDSLIESEAEGEAAAPAAKPQVRRASETGAKPAAAPATNGHGGLITEPRTVKGVRVFKTAKGDNWALTLTGDPNEYTTKDQHAALELEQFKGTDHKIRVRYEDNEWKGKVYHNIVSFAIADAPTPAAAPAPATGTMDQSEIPFAGAR